MSVEERRERCFRLRLAYRGEGFSGWQRQAGVRTVQEVVEEAVEKPAGGPVFVRGAGRTDAGVHARGQAASMSFSTRMTADKVVLALNSLLPDDVAVQAADEHPPGFDAKRHSVGKRYVYRVLAGVPRDPFLDPIAWPHRAELDVDAMKQAAPHLVGEHDYESFRASSCQAAHARRFLWLVEVTRSGPLIEIEIRGNAFCQNQVRIMAGTLVEVGRGRFAPDDVADILAARDRTRAGQTAPARGLTLEEVYYPDTAHDAGIPEGARFPGWPPQE